MGRNEDRRAARRGFVDQLPELTSCDRIDPARRLVEEHDRGLVEQRHGERELLPPAERERPHQRSGRALEPEARQHARRPLAHHFLRQINRCKHRIGDILGHGRTSLLALTIGDHLASRTFAGHGKS